MTLQTTLTKLIKSKKYYNTSIMLYSILFIQKFGITEILLILAIVLLLFGGKKIPELMRGIGKGISEFKKGQSETENDNAKSNNS